MSSSTQRPFPARGKGRICLPTLTAVLALLALSGCAPDLGALPELQQPEQLQTAQSFTVTRTAWPQEDWWKSYNDPQLDALIAEALQDSPNLKIAAARVRAAVAQAGMAQADLLPTIGASGNLIETEVSRNSQGQGLRAVVPRGWHHEAEIGAGLSYELDFFGKNRAALAAATSAADAVKAEESAARLELSTAVATVYARLLQLNAEKALAEDAVRQRKDSTDLVRQRFARQLENQGQVSRAETQIWAAQTQLDTIKRLIRLTQNELSALLGKGPDRGLSIVPPASHQTLHPLGLPEKLAADLIGRRPDILAARRRVEAAASGIDVAEAAFYPNIDLVGAFGVQTLDAGYLVTAASEMGHFGPAISLPLFDYGRRASQYRGARAGFDAAAAAYDATLTYALRDVADAYANRRAVENELADARSGLTAGEKAYAVLKERYKAGIAPYIELLGAETALIEQRRAVVDFTTTAFVYDIALVRALGGGFAAAH